MLSELPPPNSKLTPHDLHTVPEAPGLYTAWLLDEDALEEAGVAGPPPVLAYVGKGADLRKRLKQHVPPPGNRYRLPFIDLGELLAFGGPVLMNWWARSVDKGSNKYWNKPSKLGQIAVDEALDWQEQWLTWGWAETPVSRLAEVEADIIAAHAPLLNRRGRGLRGKPPQLRRLRSGSEWRRAAWLYTLSWTAVLADAWGTAPDLWSRGTAGFEGDELGFPVVSPAQRAEVEIVVPEFDPDRVRECMSATLSEEDSALSEAVAEPPRDDELLNWWAAATAWTLGHLDTEDPEAIYSMLADVFEIFLAPERVGTDGNGEALAEGDLGLALPEDTAVLGALTDAIRTGLGYERH